VRDGQAVSMPANGVRLVVGDVTVSEDIVSKDELMKALWPDSFVEEGNLTQTVFILRKALGQSLIITTPRQGYRPRASEPPAPASTRCAEKVRFLHTCSATNDRE
jgi:DNA-binding winged helix-turn-helix (wHTH) protein